MAQMKTPGVYLVEKDAFPNSVVEVATAVPAFIGYTEKAQNGIKSLLNKPFRISSFAEYMQYFGAAPDYKFEFTSVASPAEKVKAKAAGDEGGDEQKTASKVSAVVPDITVKGTGYTINRTGTVFRLFDAIRLFYQNGGGPCYIVSVGDYSGNISKGLLDGTDPDTPGWGLTPLEKEQEPTMVLAPDALTLDAQDCYGVYQQILAHCEKMMSRVAVLDVYNGYKDRKDPTEDTDVVEAFREGVGMNHLKYGAAYYPWVETTIVQETEVSFTNLTDKSLTDLQQMLLDEIGISKDPPSGDTVEEPKTKQTREFLGLIPSYNDAYVATKLEDQSIDDRMSPDDLNNTLIQLSPSYNDLLKDIQETLNELPPASAMAGIYTMVDATRGVWKAPANVSMNSVVRPSVNITFEDQQDLNVTLTGKSINAIRSFVGEGVVVWGARTLDGNSQDWRYINVRRTIIMLEQSVKAAAKAYVFEPNDAGTWTTVKSMIQNFLYQQWKSGALVGSKSEEAFSVHVGLGETMSADDILNGIMKITVLIAVSRPAEFIEITFQQQMQKS